MLKSNCIVTCADVRRWPWSSPTGRDPEARSRPVASPARHPLRPVGLIQRRPLSVPRPVGRVGAIEGIEDRGLGRAHCDEHHGNAESVVISASDIPRAKNVRRGRPRPRWPCPLGCRSRLGLLLALLVLGQGERQRPRDVLVHGRRSRIGRGLLVMRDIRSCSFRGGGRLSGRRTHTDAQQSRTCSTAWGRWSGLR